MAKNENEDDFIAALRSTSPTRRAEQPPMKLNTPPVRSGKSVNDMLAAESAGEPLISQSEDRPSSSSRTDISDHSKGFFVPMESLIAHRWNARVHRSQTRIRQIASSMASSRQFHPIAVTKAPEHPGKYFVVDGETRWKAGVHLKWKDIWAVEVDVDPNDPAAFYFESSRQTDATSAISSVDRGLRWSELIESGVTTPETISTELDVSKSTVSKMLAYSKFPPRVVEFMHDNAESFPYTIATLLVGLADADASKEEELLSICKRIVDEEFSRRSVETLLAQRKSGTKRQPRRSPLITRTIKNANQPIGSFRTYENGAIEFKLNGNAVPQAAIDQVIGLLDLAAETLGSGSEDFRAAFIAKLSENSERN